MQSEAFHYNKSFEHSPKPSKHPNYTFVYASNVKNVKLKNVEKYFWPVRKYVTKNDEFNGAVHFA